MTLQVELDPETELWLAAESVRRGIAPEKFVSEFLRERIPRIAQTITTLTPADIDEISSRLSEGSEHLPILPTEVNDRSSYYEDRW
jgi:hypothetical protein